MKYAFCFCLLLAFGIAIAADDLILTIEPSKPSFSIGEPILVNCYFVNASDRALNLSLLAPDPVSFDCENARMSTVPLPLAGVAHMIGRALASNEKVNKQCYINSRFQKPALKFATPGLHKINYTCVYNTGTHRNQTIRGSFNVTVTNDHYEVEQLLPPIHTSKGNYSSTVHMVHALSCINDSRLYSLLERCARNTPQVLPEVIDELCRHSDNVEARRLAERLCEEPLINDVSTAGTKTDSGEVYCALGLQRLYSCFTQYRVALSRHFMISQLISSSKIQRQMLIDFVRNGDAKPEENAALKYFESDAFDECISHVQALLRDANVEPRTPNAVQKP